MSRAKALVRRWRSGQVAAAAKKDELAAAAGPDPQQAVAEALAALNALETMGLWPAPRDPSSERAALNVHRRWARIQRRARAAQQR